MEEIFYKATKICRLCLKSCEKSVPIFDEGILLHSKTFKECIEDLGKITLSPLDNLPETTCQQCFKQFSETYSFVFQIRKNDEFLHNIVKYELIEEDYIDNAKSNADDLPVADIEEQTLCFDEAVPMTEESVPIVADKNDTQCISEEGELPQYIEIAYVQPTSELIPVSFTNSDVVAVNSSSSIDSVQCSYCPKTFAKLKYKREHERYHLEEGRKCPHCERKFIKKSDWTRHVNTHTLERAFTCPTCSKIFVTRAELNRHEKTHNDIRQHKCEHCTNEFKDIGALKFHIRKVHLKERPYVCENCGKAFATATHVRRHQKSKSCSTSTLHQEARDDILTVVI